MSFPPPPPLSVRVLCVTLISFALWTLACQVVVAMGGTLWHLIVVVVIVAAAGTSVGLRRRPRPRPPVTTPVGPPGAPVDGLGAPWLVPTVSAVAAAATLLLFSRTGDIRVWWTLSVIQLAAAWAISSRVPGRTVPPVESPARERGLWALAVVCAVLTLVAHRPSMDDAFYVNVAVHVAQDPGAPLLERDTIFGLEGMPIQLPIYRLHTIEVLGGLISFLTGLPAILSMHWVVAGLAALFLPLAHALLFRELLPRHWLLATFLSCLTLLTWGGERIAYGNFAFVHLFQGKAIFASSMVPLLVALALRWSREPSRGNFALLLAGQIGAVGLSWIALALGPLVVALTLLGAWTPTRRGTRTLVLGLVPSFYAIGTGFLVRRAVRAQPVDWEEVVDPPRFMLQSLEKVVGDGAFLLLVLFLMLWAWTLLPSMRSRRVLATIPLGFLLILFNPWLVRWVAPELGNLDVYPRVFWSLPLPMLVAVGLCAPGLWWRNRHPSFVGGGLSIALATALLLALGPTSTLSRANGTRLDWPGPKVPYPEYELARSLVEQAGPGGAILAPAPVAAWVTTFEDHPRPVYSRHNYDSYLRWFVGHVEANRRRTLVRAVEGKQQLTIPQLRVAASTYGVTAICTRNFDPRRGELIMQRVGFQRKAAQGDYEVWVREGPVPPPRKGARGG